LCQHHHWTRSAEVGQSRQQSEERRTRILIIDDDRGTTVQPDRANRTEADVEDAGARVDPELVHDVLERVTEVLAHTAGSGGNESAVVGTSASITIDLPTQMVYRAGQAVRVTPTEFRLLAALVRRRGAVASRDDLRRDVWPGAEVQPRVVDTHIARLRRKLEHDPRQPRHILTALAAGYRFRA
jgi:two-component system KDP operon response regulator KdpE